MDISSVGTIRVLQRMWEMHFSSELMLRIKHKGVHGVDPPLQRSLLGGLKQFMCCKKNLDWGEISRYPTRLTKWEMSTEEQIFSTCNYFGLFLIFFVVWYRFHPFFPTFEYRFSGNCLAQGWMGTDEQENFKCKYWEISAYQCVMSHVCVTWLIPEVKKKVGKFL